MVIGTPYQGCKRNSSKFDTQSFDNRNSRPIFAVSQRISSWWATQRTVCTADASLTTVRQGKLGALRGPCRTVFHSPANQFRESRTFGTTLLARSVRDCRFFQGHGFFPHCERPMAISLDFPNREEFSHRILESRRIRWTLLLVGIVLWIPLIWRRVAVMNQPSESAAVAEMALQIEEVH